ncbi:MAG: hypothetical protein QY302_03620 [Anaerolineales bacterium]|nr:MAG: hypothetical protein QY302_03620 [Anaerolineales bacterium]
MRKLYKLHSLIRLFRSHYNFKPFEKSIPEKQEAPASTIVDWSFLDNDNGQPDELPDWAKRQIKRLERRMENETSRELAEHMILMLKWTRNIPPPSTPKKYNPNEPPFDPSEILGGMEMDDFDDNDEDDE